MQTRIDLWQAERHVLEACGRWPLSETYQLAAHVITTRRAQLERIARIVQEKGIVVEDDLAEMIQTLQPDDPGRSVGDHL